MAITPNTPNPVREDSYTTELATKLGIDPKYIPKSPVWRNEEELAAIAEMFSNMAGGSSGGGVLAVHDVNGTLDKTWQEIYDAFPNVYVDMYADGSKSALINIYSSHGEYGLNVDDTDMSPSINYYTEAADGYPVKAD